MVSQIRWIIGAVGLGGDSLDLGARQIAAPFGMGMPPTVFPSLPQGKLNAVRAAFKAGVTPARIAREFGISRSDVQKTLAGDVKK